MFIGADQIAEWLTCPMRQARRGAQRDPIGTPVETILRLTCERGEPFEPSRVKYDKETAHAEALNRARKAVLQHFDGWLGEYGFRRDLDSATSRSVALTAGDQKVRVHGGFTLFLVDGEGRRHAIKIDTDVWRDGDRRHGSLLAELAVNCWVHRMTAEEQRLKTAILLRVPRASFHDIQTTTTPFGELAGYGESLAKNVVRGVRDEHPRPGVHCAYCFMRTCAFRP